MRDMEGHLIFPGFVTAFDLEAMKTLIKEALSKDNTQLQVTKCEIADVKYEPRKKCVLLYKTKIQDESAGKTWEQFVTGILLQKNEVYAAGHEKEIFLKDQKIILLPFPYDHILSWLPDMYHEDSVKTLLCRSRPKHSLIPSKVNTSLLIYKPQMRATFQYEIFAENRKTGATDWHHWIAKTNVFRSSKRVFANYWALWKASKGKIPMPKPIGFLLDPQWTLQEKVEGTRLGAMVNSESFGEIIKKTATLIARFHNLEIPLCNTRKLDQELRMINPRCEVLIHLFPDLKQRLESLRKKIIADLESRIDIRAPIHADFHHTNLLVDGTQVRLIDVDEMAFGDPCVDIGRFLSSLRIPSLRAFGSFEGLEPMRELFLETYLKNTPGNIQNIRLFESSSLLTSAASVFRSQRPDWKNEVQMLLDDSERTFEKARERKTLPFSSHCDRWKKLSLESRLKWALDKTYIHALLTPALFEKTRQTLVFCKNLGYKEEESVYQIIYKTITRKGREKTTKELELLLFKKRSGRSVYKHLLAVNEAARKKGLPTLQPDPIAYFTELGALVLEVPKEKALLYREPKT